MCGGRLAFAQCWKPVINIRNIAAPAIQPQTNRPRDEKISFRARDLLSMGLLSIPGLDASGFDRWIAAVPSALGGLPGTRCTLPQVGHFMNRPASDTSTIMCWEQDGFAQENLMSLDLGISRTAPHAGHGTDCPASTSSTSTRWRHSGLEQLIFIPLIPFNLEDALPERFSWDFFHHG